MTKDLGINKRLTKSDLLLAGWHNVYRDGNDEWHHPKLAAGYTLSDAKHATKLFGLDSYGELNVTSR